MSNKDITSKNDNTAISTDMRPAYAGTGRGSEHVQTDDLVIPRIGIVQALSPERKKNDASYIEGAEEGMMFNSVTRALYKEPILVIPVYYRKEFFLWKPRKEGGGFRGVFPTLRDASNAQVGLTEVTEIKDVGQQFCLVSADGGDTWTEAVVSMSSSNGSVSKKWNSDIRLKECDRFALVYELSAISKTNEKGEFYIFKPHFKRWATQEEYTAGERSYQAVSSGARDIARDYDGDEPAHTEKPAGGGTGNEEFF